MTTPDPHACICPPGQKPRLVCLVHFGEENAEGRDACPDCQRLAAHPYHSHTRCPADHAAGVMCHNHFEMVRRREFVAKWMQTECQACQDAQKAYDDHIQQNETIDPSQPWGDHIGLTCKNHPNLRWHTKNIDYIGARSIFFRHLGEPECSCPISDLIVVPPTK